MELGETLEDVAKRELYEETNLTANVLSLFNVYSGKELYYRYPHGDEVYNVVATFICENFEGELMAEKNEVSSLQFFSIDDLPSNISPPDLPIVSEYIQIQRGRRLKIIHLNEVAGKSITQFDSNFIMRKLLMTNQPSHVGIMDLGENGIVGYHEATVPQMLIVIEGEGWVLAGEDAKARVTAGNVVLWEKGEGHETTTSKGMKAIVIESEGMDIETILKR